MTRRLSFRLHPNALAVADHLNGAVVVCAEQQAFVYRRRQPRLDLPVRMPVPIVRSRRDHRQRRIDLVQKGGSAGRPAAVMRRLQYGAFQRQGVANQAGFSLGLDIGGKQYAGLSVNQPQDHGIVVPIGSLTSNWPLRRIQHLQTYRRFQFYPVSLL